MSKISDEDRKLFRNTLTDIQKLKPTDRIKPTKKAPVFKRKKIISEDDAMTPLSDQFNPNITTNQSINFKRPGVNDRILQKLHNRTLAISASLDLHGETQEAARTLLNQFIQQCYKKNKRYLKIVHGKGLSSKSDYPILKNQIYHWLPQFPEVLAFQSASPRDGGTGAVYVLLKAVVTPR